MEFDILLSQKAERNYASLQSPVKKNILKAINKTLDLMSSNLRYSSLHTHEFHELKGPDGEKIWESYAQNNTPGAYQMFWYYGPEKGKITIATIIPRP